MVMPATPEELAAALAAKQEKVDELQAVILEYEHALELVIDCKTCPECPHVARAALAGEHREGFRLQVRIEG